MHKKQKYIYIGVDTHKFSHTAVIINCWDEVLGEITIENKPAAFNELVAFIDKVNTGLIPVYGLEDVGGTGRSLAVFLVENGFITKEVNPALAHAYRMSAPTSKKNDSYDARCIAYVLLNKLDSLSDAQPKDIYWTLSQLVGAGFTCKTPYGQRKPATWTIEAPLPQL
jgi:transposase